MNLIKEKKTAIEISEVSESIFEKRASNTVKSITNYNTKTYVWIIVCVETTIKTYEKIDTEQIAIETVCLLKTHQVKLRKDKCI
jgi:hypothetical protein